MKWIIQNDTSSIDKSDQTEASDIGISVRTISFYFYGLLMSTIIIKLIQNIQRQVNLPPEELFTEDRCSGWGGRRTAGDVMGSGICEGYLFRLGDQPCRASKSGTRMCTYGKTGIWGFSKHSAFTSAKCSDVSWAVGRIRESCKSCSHPECSVLGQYQLLSKWLLTSFFLFNG
jgi:hypothetical protein